VYDSVGLVKALFVVFGRKKSIGKRQFGKAGVKGAYFAFILTLDTRILTFTISLETKIRVLF
jgi:hypothetical protein